MRRIEPAERRARLGRRHHLAPDARASDVVEAAGDLVGLHGTDPASVYLAILARLPAGDPGAEPAAIEHALYEARSVVRMLGMRRTMFVEPLDLVPVVQAATGNANAAVQRRNTIQMIADAAMADDPAAWLAEIEAETMVALAARGEATATELSAVVDRLAMQIPVGAGTRWEGTIGMSTRVLFLLAAEGRIVRGRPRGSWLSSMYRWTPMTTWLRGELTVLSTDTARVELVRRWLRSFGPGTAADIKWWTGWTLGETRKALAAVDVVEVALGDAVGYVLADDVDPIGGDDAAGCWAALLPALDPTTMGWTGRDWYLGQHRSALFDTNGNAGPTVWVDGRVVGGWAQLHDGRVVLRLLEDVGAEARRAIEVEAERVSGWLGPSRVRPRFRTPLEQELMAAEHEVGARLGGVARRPTRAAR